MSSSMQQGANCGSCTANVNGDAVSMDTDKAMLDHSWQITYVDQVYKRGAMSGNLFPLIAW